ncbi:MAG: hypothetical protein U5N55_00915 [Cypionkella sp.]|nr:hypothetical protein [Cypionkella sp.]
MRAWAIIECVTYSFIDAKAAVMFGGGDEATRIENPISSEMTHLRPDLLPGLLAAAARNQARGFADMALFEVGTAFTGGEPGDQQLQATGLLVGRHRAARPLYRRAPPCRFFMATSKADAEAVLAAIGAPAKVQINRKCVAPWWHPGRAGRVIGAGAREGDVRPFWRGASPACCAEMGVKGPAPAFTIWLAAMPFPKAENPTPNPHWRCNALTCKRWSAISPSCSMRRSRRWWR